MYLNEKTVFLITILNNLVIGKVLSLTTDTVNNIINDVDFI